MDYLYEKFEYIPKVGEIIDENVIISEIGEGGRSRVYKVKNMSLEVERVIKLLKKPNEIDEDRFVTEARISANLNHPNIVQCYRFAKYKGELPYIEMEYVNGHDLHYLIRKNIRLPYSVTLAILHYVCEALKILHSCEYTLYDVKRKGVVHRDIKPGNILISRKGEVKLADFGIAKPRDLTIHTTEMQVVGTVYYLSPEQIRRERLDFTTDIYSLGCVIYEMVTGRKAFKHKNLMDVMEAKRNSNYDQNILDTFPRAFKDLVEKCLSPNKNERFRNVQELQDEIDLLLKREGKSNLKGVISDFVQDPETYTAIQRVKRKKMIRRSAILPIVFLVLGTAILFTATLIYLNRKTHKNKEVLIDDKTETIKELDKKIDDTLTVDSDNIIDSADNKKDHAGIEKSVDIKEKISKRSALAKKELYSAEATDPLKNFLEGKYKEVIAVTSSIKELNDTLLLIRAGSFYNLNELENAEKIFSSIISNDAYLHYLKGRIAFQRGDFEVSIIELMSSLTKPSFYKKIPYLANYSIALCREKLYLKQPNSGNHKNMMKSFDLFLKNYCRGKNSSNCERIRKLRKKYN